VKTVTPGLVLALAFAFIVAGAGAMAPSSLRWGLVAAGVGLAVIWIALLVRDKRERKQRGELKELLERVAAVGQETLRRGPTFDAWRKHSESLLAAAIGESAAAEVLGPPAAGAVKDIDPMEVLAGYPFGQEYVEGVFRVAAHLDDFTLVRCFMPSAWSPFDPDQWEQEHARPIAWEPQNGGPCPWCGNRIYPTSGTCDECGAQVGVELAFK
jgi:hypothetical protein